MVAVAAATDYERELRRLDAEIEALRDVRREPVVDVATATTLAYRRFQRASLTGALENYAAARADVEEFIRRIGPDPDLHFLAANIDVSLHRLPEAREHLAGVPGLASSPVVRGLAADIALQEGRYDEARRAYERLVEDDRSWENLARLAGVVAKFGDLDAADGLYRAAEDELTAKEMRSFAWVALQRGLLDVSRGRFDDARSHYARAERAYSGHWRVDEHAARLLAAEGRVEEAVALYHRVALRSPSPTVQHAVGDLHARAGNDAEARRWHDRALRGYVASARRGEVCYYHHLAEFYSDSRSNGPEALRWAQADLALRKNAGTWCALAWACHTDGRTDDAVRSIRTALAYGVVDVPLLGRAAAIHRAAGDLPESMRILDRAAAIGLRVGGVP